MTTRFVVAVLISLWGILAVDPAMAQGRRGEHDRNRRERYGSESYRRHDYRGGQEWSYGPTWPDYGRPYPGYSPGYINQGSSYYDPCAPRFDYPALGRDLGRSAGEGFRLGHAGSGKTEFFTTLAGVGLDALSRKRCHDRLEREERSQRDDRRSTSFDEPRERVVERIVYRDREPEVDDRRLSEDQVEPSPVRRITPGETPRTRGTRTWIRNCATVPVKIFQGGQQLWLFREKTGGGASEWLQPGGFAFIDRNAGVVAVGYGTGKLLVTFAENGGSALIVTNVSAGDTGK